MPRIIKDTVLRGTSAVYRPELDEDYEPDLDTADRGMRDRVMRGPMHETSDTEQDARNTPRMSHADVAWRQPMSLDAPHPRLGYAQRWIRVSLRGGENDILNVQSKGRVGWTPRRPDTVPEGELFSSLSTNSNAHGDVIRVGNLVLHEIPIEKLKSQRAYNRSVAKRQEESVAMETDKASREGVRAGYSPIVREERTQATTGRRPQTLAD